MSSERALTYPTACVRAGCTANSTLAAVAAVPAETDGLLRRLSEAVSVASTNTSWKSKATLTACIRTFVT